MKAVSKFVVAMVLATACGGKSPPPAAPPAPPAQKALPDVPFDKLADDQQVEFMKQKVVPQMKPIFQQHDGKKFAEFGCTTCHGPGAKQGHFDMPNPELPKLSMKELMGGTKYKKDDVEWMSKQVKPTVAKLLGQTEWSPDNPKGFSCGACHVMEE